MPEDDHSKTKPNLINPKRDEDFFSIGRILLSHSTCLKTQTAALIVTENKIISWGVNMCCPQGQIYGLPVSECPRMNTKTGTFYELCKPIHAEIVAAINAFGISHIDSKSLWHFPGFTLKLKHYEGFFQNKNSKLYLLGHYWACQECVDFLKLIGITEIKFDDLSGGKTLKEYRTKNIAGKDHSLDVSGCLVEGVVTVRIKPLNVEEFCARNQLKETDISLPFPPKIDQEDEKETGTLYLVKVPDGSEIIKARNFKNDPLVEESGVLLQQNT